MYVAEERLLKIAPGSALGVFENLVLPGPSEKGFDLALLIKANIIRSGRAKKAGPDDSNILSSVGALTEIETSINLLQERIAEWIGKTWEEPGKHLIEKGVLESLSTSSTFGEFMGRLTETNPGLKDRLSTSIPDPEMSLQGIPLLASSMLDLNIKRRSLESYIDTEMETTAPNLKKVVGPVIGARLIQSAAGLQRLALLPASTVQVLGAEKAFFKFLKEGGKPPKHGILFQHPQVHSARRDLRGKMARTIANAASRAARLDAYGGAGGEDIRAHLDERIEAIKALPARAKSAIPLGRQPPFREGWWADKGQRKDRGPPGKRFKRRP